MTVEEIAATLAACSRSGEAAIVEGGRTLRGMGAAPARADVAIVTSGLQRILEHAYDDLTCAVEGGVTLAVLRSALAERGQFVPIDAPLAARATVGGTLAAGWLGGRRHRYGRPRDAVIGTTAVLADGSIAHAGGMVVKNVTGYDMSKLYAGSFGTLGVLVRVNLKTFPAPAQRRAVLARIPDGARNRAFAQIASLPIPPAAAYCVEGFRSEVGGDDGVDGRAIVLLEGSERLVERATRDLRTALGRAGIPEAQIVEHGAWECYERVQDALVATLGDRSITIRSLGLPSAAAARSIALRDTCHRHRLYTELVTDVMNGDAYLRISDRESRGFAEKIEGCDDALRAIDPRRAVIACDAPIRESIDPWGEPPPSFAVMQALKARFDPQGVLNRGRFVGGL